MNSVLEAVGMWLADFHLLSAALLATVLAVQGFVRQPARRMAITKSTLAAIAALAALCALPGWSVVHLLSADEPPDVATTFSTDTLHTGGGQLAESRDEPRLQAPTRSAQALDAMPLAASAVDAGESMLNFLVDRWQLGLLGVHAAGSAAVFAWLVCGGLLARRVHRRAVAAPSHLVELLQRIVGDQRAPELLLSDEVKTAAAMGVLRARILLGHALLEGSTIAAELRSAGSAPHGGPAGAAAALAHEWAHIRNGDLWSLALSRLLLVLAWPQPLYWWFRRRMRLDQETLADAAAAVQSGRVDYAEQLLGWAQRAAELRPRGQAPRLAGAVGLWEGTSPLKTRVAALLDDKFMLIRECSRQWRLCSGGLVLAAASGLSLVTLGRAETALEAPAAPKESAATAEPGLPDAAQATVAEPIPSNDAAPVADGDAAAGVVIAPPQRAAEPNVVAGVCVDEKGKTLAGVKITLYGYEQKERDRVNLRVIAENVTGADGQFRFEQVVDVPREYPLGLPDDNFPQPPIKVLSVVARAEGRAASREDSIASWAARHGMAPYFVLTPAATLTGQVTGPDGKPVSGAEVIVGFGGSPDGTVNTARTDAQGRYSINDLAAFDGAEARAAYVRVKQRRLEAGNDGEKTGQAAAHDDYAMWMAPPMMILVKHPDFATKRVDVDNIPGQQDVQLQPAAAIEGRVQLDKGANGGVSPAAWAVVMLVRDVPEREPDDRSRLFAYQTEQTATDAEGRYRFGSLPAGTYHLMARAKGAASPALKGVSVIAGRATAAPDLVMTPGGVVRFTLVDQATGAPLDLADGAKVYVNPYSRPELPVGLTPAGSNVVRLSAGAKGEVRLPPGEYVLLVSIPGDDARPFWQSENFATFRQAPGVRVDEGAVVDATIPMTKIQRASLPTGALALAGPPADQDRDEKAPEAQNTFVPATPPTDGANAPADASRYAVKAKAEKFVRLVVGQNGELTFEGQRTTWETLGGLLEKVPDRDKTVFEVAIAADDMTVREANNAQMMGFRLAGQFKFLYSSYVGTHPLGSKGGDEPRR